MSHRPTVLTAGAAALLLLGATHALAQPAASPRAAAPTVRPVTSVTVGVSPFAVATAGGKVFAAVQGGNKVTVVDPATNRVVKRLRGLPEPSAVISSADGSAVFVSTGAERSVVRIDATTYRRTAYAVNGGGTLAAAPNGRYLLASPGGGDVSRIALRTGAVTQLAGTAGWNVQDFSPDGDFAYVERVVIDPESGIPQPRLLKVRTGSWKVRARAEILSDTEWSFAGDIQVDPTGRNVYVSKQGNNNGFTGYNGRTVQRYRASDLKPGTVYTIDRSSVETNVELGPQGLAFPERHWRGRLAVANSNTGKVSVIDVRTGAVTTRKSGFGASDVTYAGDQLYVANTGFGGNFPKTLSVFRVAPGLKGPAAGPGLG